MTRLKDFTVREGVTTKKTFFVYSEAGVVNLTGVDHISFVIVPNNGAGTAAEYASSGGSPKTAIESATTGEVSWTPADGDMTRANSPYKCHWRVYTDATNYDSYPENEDMIMTVLVKGT